MSGRADKVPEVVYAESREEAQRLLDESYLKKYRAVPVEGDALLAENQRLRDALEFWYREVDKAQRIDNTGGDSAVAVTLNSFDEYLHDDREALAGDGEAPPLPPTSETHVYLKGVSRRPVAGDTE